MKPWPFILARRWPSLPLFVVMLCAIVCQLQAVGQERHSGSGRISLDFQQVPVRAALATLSKAGDVNLVVGKEVAGDITLKLDDVEWQEALDRILESHSLKAQRTGDTLVVTLRDQPYSMSKRTPASGNSLLPVEVLPLGHADAKEMAALFSRQGFGEVLGPEGVITQDARTNQLLVRAQPPQLQQLRQLVKQLDVAMAQVQIEARIVIAHEQVARELGIRWGQVGVGRGASEWARVQHGAQPLAQGHGPFMGLALDLGNQRQPQASVGWGVLKHGTLLGLELNAMEQDGISHTLSQPRIMTLDREPATIRQGQEVPYQEAGSYGSTSTSFRDAVLALTVTPQITPDNRVLMKVDLQNDSVAADRFNGLPAINTSRITTRVMVENGETVVLGGILTKEQARDRRKIPWLGRIPALGALFRYAAKRHEQVELLVFITPNIIKES